MNFISRQVVGCGKRALRDSCRRSAVLSANYGIIVDRCVIGTSASTFQRRHASSEPPRSLATCLVSEIAGEDETTPSAEFIEIVNEIEKTFKIIDEPGRGVVKLTRKFKDESIEVRFDCQDEADAPGDEEDEEQDDNAAEDSDEEEEEVYAINFEVIITKGGGDKMVVKCIATDRVHIEKLRYVPAGKDTADLDLYSGPVFDTLDPELSRAFFAYLEDRNINDDMADFITTYSREKEQNEYAHWLQQLANFTTDPNDVSKA